MRNLKTGFKKAGRETKYPDRSSIKQGNNGLSGLSDPLFFIP